MRPPADMPMTLNDDGTEDYECKDCPHGIKLQPGIGIIYESEDADDCFISGVKSTGQGIVNVSLLRSAKLFDLRE